MFTDAMTSIKAYLYERAVSPLLGSLIVSWALWNYRFFFIALGDLKYSEKMDEIDRFYALTETHNLLWLFEWTVSNFWTLGVLFPLATSFIYLFVFPYPAKWVYKFSLKKQNELSTIKNIIEDKKLLSEEQSRALRFQLAETEKQFDEQIERKDRAIEVRDRELSELRDQLAILKGERDKAIDQLNISNAITDELASVEVEETENVTQIHDAPREGSGEVFEDGEESSEEKEQQGFSTELLQQPDYIKFYGRLDWIQKDATEFILNLLLEEPRYFSDLYEELINESQLSDLVSDFTGLRKLFGKLKLYEIVNGIKDTSGEVTYVLSDKGKDLYKYIIENEHEIAM